MASLVQSLEWVDLPSDIHFARFARNLAASQRAKRVSIFSGQGVTISHSVTKKSAIIQITNSGTKGVAAYLRDEQAVDLDRGLFEEPRQQLTCEREQIGKGGSCHFLDRDTGDIQCCPQSR